QARNIIGWRNMSTVVSRPIRISRYCVRVLRTANGPPPYWRGKLAGRSTRQAVSGVAFIGG
ncbi:MAG TPA: hypothetical protein VIH59_09085, partial [Candidatus Tectomicrobia bacterium]